MSENSQETLIPPDKLVRTYMRMRDKRDGIKREMEQQIEALDEKMKVVKAALLEYCKTNGVESIRTPNGSAYRTVKTVYSTGDWESFYKFVVEQDVPYLLEKRLHQGNVKQFMEDNPAKRHFAAAGIIQNAVHNAFPCD